MKLIIDCLATSNMIPNYEDELNDEQGSIMAIKLEYSSDEEVKQVARKKKGNIDINQSQITSFFDKK